MAQTEPMSSIANRLADGLVTTSGEPASQRHVEEIVEATAKSFAGARLQQFVPLLVEHQARDTLRREGMRRAPLSATRSPY
jgi:hypothetical protein